MREADLIVEIEKRLAKDRQKKHGGTAPGRKKNTSADISQSVKGRANDRVSTAVGMKRDTYEKARKIYEAANGIGQGEHWC